MTDQIIIDIADWAEDARRAEVDFADKDALLAEHVKNKWTPLRTGRLAIAARHIGRAPEGILPACKMLLNTGAAVDIVLTFARKRRKARVDGKEYMTREFVGAVADEEGFVSPGETYVPSASDEGSTRAREYLENTVPGHIWSRLLILAEHGAPVGEIAEALKTRIDKMVEKLTQEVSETV